ncbi:hypothetical protein BDA99DRAFT_200111 [Phascolomyces articulosus]|uniref:Uncharacterized protein n=1 Tax=Phascolomyces articulosus TaxID=60185 RepID=A0AAD5PIF4_9FUNG|nr:hypothetical protein BDA99DRAFT_200111 [Phascolomyces articulosus]
MNPPLNPSTSSSSLSTRGTTAWHDGTIDERAQQQQQPMYINESESGIEASVSSEDNGDDDDQSQRTDEPSLIQRAVRSARRSSHLHRQQDFMKLYNTTNKNKKKHGTSSSTTTKGGGIEQTSMLQQLESLPQQEQAMAIAGIENATHGHGIGGIDESRITATEEERVPSSSSSTQSHPNSTIAHHQQQQQQHDIPTPSSGYDGDTEGTLLDQQEQLHRHHQSLHEQLVHYSQLHQRGHHHHHHHPVEVSSGNVSSS